MALVWFAFAASDELSRAIVDTALRVGDSVSTFVDRDGWLAELRDRYPGHVLVADISDAANGGYLNETVQRWGRVDVVLTSLAARIHSADPYLLETEDLQSARARLENFWAVVEMFRSVAPILRRQGDGLIVQLAHAAEQTDDASDLSALVDVTVEGLGRVARAELASAGVAVMVARLSTDPSTDIARAAEVIVTVAHRGAVPSQLPLGSQALNASIAAQELQLMEARRWADVSRSVDAGAAFPVPFPQ